MTSVHDRSNRFPLLRVAGVVFGATVVLAAGSAWALGAWGAGEQAMAAGWSFGICGAAGLIGLVPVAWLDRRMPGGAAYGFMVSILVRLVVCATAVFIARRWGAGPPFTYWMGGAYLAMLGIEVGLISGYVKRMRPRETGHGRTLEAKQCST